MNITHNAELSNGISISLYKRLSVKYKKKIPRCRELHLANIHNMDKLLSHKIVDYKVIIPKMADVVNRMDLTTIKLSPKKSG